MPKGTNMNHDDKDQRPLRFKMTKGIIVKETSAKGASELLRHSQQHFVLDWYRGDI